MAKRRNILWLVSVVAAVVFVAALSVGLGLGSLRSGTGVADRGADTLVTANVSWIVTDASGNIKSQGAGHNFTTVNLVNDARTRLSTVTTVNAAALYSNIALCETASTGTSTTTNGGTVLAACTLSSNAGTNPVLATVTNTTQGVYTAVTTFTAAGAVTINQIELSKNLVTSTAPATTDIGAVKGVTIVLAATDTLQITWTVTVS